MLAQLDFSKVKNRLLDDDHVRLKLSRKHKSGFGVVVDRIEGDELRLLADHDENFLLDLLHNDGRLYRRFTAKGSFGNYFIDVKGLGGVYFYWAPEFGITGYFLSLEDASNLIISNWSDSLVSISGRNYRRPFKKRLLDLGDNEDQLPSQSQRSSIVATLEQPAFVVQPKSEPEIRVLGFYRRPHSEDVYYHSKFGSDGKSDLTRLVLAALDASVQDFNAACAKARELEWVDAIRVLESSSGVRNRMAKLELEVEELKRNRIVEIEVDDWCRGKSIQDPKLTDFERMAKEMKPIFHYREAAQAWDTTRARTYQLAYESVRQIRLEIKARREQEG